MALDDGCDSAIIFSHDHGINDFVNKFGDKVIPHVPTCGVVAIEFNTKHWKNIKVGKTLFTEFPRYYK
jgi:phosphohistidine phosphatase